MDDGIAALERPRDGIAVAHVTVDFAQAGRAADGRERAATELVVVQHRDGVAAAQQFGHEHRAHIAGTARQYTHGSS